MVCNPKGLLFVAGLTVFCAVHGMECGLPGQDDVTLSLGRLKNIQQDLGIVETALKRMGSTGLKSGWTNAAVFAIATLAACVAAFVVDTCQNQHCVKWIYKKSCEIKEKYFAAPSAPAVAPTTLVSAQPPH